MVQTKGQIVMLKNILDAVDTGTNPVLTYKKKLALSSLNVMEQLVYEVAIRLSHHGRRLIDS